MATNGIGMFYSNPFCSYGGSMFGLGMSGGGRLTNASTAYLPFWNILPMAATNFGGDIQIFPVEPYQQSRVGMAFNSIAQQTWGIPGIGAGFGMTPCINYQAVEAQAAQMTASSLNQISSQYINSSLQAITCQKTRLQAQLNNKDIKAEDKEKIQAQIKELEDLEKQLEELKKSDTDAQTAHQKASELAAKVNKTITEQNTQKAEENNDSKVDNNDDGKVDNKNNNQEEDNKNNKQGEQGAVNNFSQTVKDRVNKFYNAINGIGTDNDAMEQALDETLGDNTLVEFALRWNDKYSSKNGESMIEAFMGDADHAQAAKYVPLMVEKLYDKAEELGICDEEFKAAYNKIQDELTDSYAINGMDDDLVCENFDKMVEIIGKKMGSKHAQKSSKAE